MPIEFRELKNVLEAAILTSELPVSVAQLSSLFSEDEHPGVAEIERALLELQRSCDNRGVELQRVGMGYRFQSRQRYAPWLMQLFETKPRRYSKALMETLSIIAYRQPVTRGDIESIRGVSVSSEIIKTLIGNDWIYVTGHKQVPGRPALYGTTVAFLECFNLDSLADLPALDDGDAQPELSFSERQSADEMLSLVDDDRAEDDSAGVDHDIDDVAEDESPERFEDEAADGDGEQRHE